MVCKLQGLGLENFFRVNGDNLMQKINSATRPQKDELQSKYFEVFEFRQRVIQ